MQIIGMDHVQLAMPKGEEAVARAFYTELLGMQEVLKPADLAKRGGCWFELGTVRLHLGVEQPFHPARKAHPALLVDDLQAFRKRLLDAAIEVTDGSPIDGYVRVFISDPFGNRIELMQSNA